MTFHSNAIQNTLSLKYDLLEICKMNTYNCLRMKSVNTAIGWPVE